jgi:hypothetical protein
MRSDDMQITDEQHAQIAYYAHMSPEAVRAMWTTPRPSPAIGVCLHHWMELHTCPEESTRTAMWRYRTGKRQR